MNINKIIEKERKIKSYKETEGIINEFSRSLLVSNEVNQALVNYVRDYNVIDFDSKAIHQEINVEKKIKEIYNNSQNKQDIGRKNHPVILFKNFDKCGSLEESLLPIFDSQ